MYRSTTDLAALALLCALFAPAAQGEEVDGERILETRVTLDLEQASVRKVIQAIAQKTGLQYMATDEVLDKKPTLTIHVKSLAVREVFEFLEDSCHLNLEFGRLEETGVLLLAEREPEGPAFDPQLDHPGALKIIHAHPTIAQLLKAHPALWVRVEWDEHDREWHGELIRGDEEEVGHVTLREFDKGDPRILDVEIERDKLPRRAPPAKKGGNPDEEF